MARAPRSRGEWEGLVASFEGSGLSAAAFAAEHGVGPSTLKWWRWLLRRAASTKALVPFARVEVATTAVATDPRPARTHGVRLELPGGCVLHFDADADGDYVARVTAGTAARLSAGARRC